MNTNIAQYANAYAPFFENSTLYIRKVISMNKNNLIHPPRNLRRTKIKQAETETLDDELPVRLSIPQPIYILEGYTAIPHREGLVFLDQCSNVRNDNNLRMFNERNKGYLMSNSKTLEEGKTAILSDIPHFINHHINQSKIFFQHPILGEPL